ncbi:hypothetical protein M407DRAFT_244737 [Tulasnella calospora MUT 4182]|uniref:Uncharacterized protein n=1 Tax=Tulasnella calospora MUT 4182 TaxID=1051891 RepID=A0A0C3Q3V1_9AGAM|nr:hypothetical protein M407DRAFT_244737 [Tulasnella calospora MUT 4182]
MQLHRRTPTTPFRAPCDVLVSCSTSRTIATTATPVRSPSNWRPHPNYRGGLLARPTTVTTVTRVRSPATRTRESSETFGDVLVYVSASFMGLNLDWMTLASFYDLQGNKGPIDSIYNWFANVLDIVNNIYGPST